MGRAQLDVIGVNVQHGDLFASAHRVALKLVCPFYGALRRPEFGSACELSPSQILGDCGGGNKARGREEQVWFHQGGLCVVEK
jgi:hypothetical protein